MTIQNLTLTPSSEAYVRRQVEDGSFSTADEVIEAAITRMAHSETDLDAMIHAGFSSGFVEGDIFAEVLEELVPGKRAPSAQ